MKLMLAEDEPGLSRALTAILQHSDYEVDTALDGLTALEYLLANDYDAAILDIMMPGMDGIEVLKRIREVGKRLPIIMLTAKSEVSDKVEGLDAGANDYLTKPFAAKELLAPIFLGGRRVYDSPPIAEMRAYCAGQIDLLWDEVKRFENPHNYYVDLSQKLWDIKQSLLEQKG